MSSNCDVKCHDARLFGNNHHRYLNNNFVINMVLNVYQNWNQRRSLRCISSTFSDVITITIFSSYYYSYEGVSKLWSKKDFMMHFSQCLQKLFGNIIRISSLLLLLRRIFRFRWKDAIYVHFNFIPVLWCHDVELFRDVMRIA